MIQLTDEPIDHEAVLRHVRSHRAGAAVLRDDGGNLVDSATTVAVGDGLHVEMRDGSFSTQVMQADAVAPRKAAPARAKSAKKRAPAASADQGDLF